MNPQRLSFYVSADARLNENSVIIDLGAGKLDLAVVEFDGAELRAREAMPGSEERISMNCWLIWLAMA